MSGTSTSTSASTNLNQRYVFIDALRGIASFGVLFHHMLHNSVMEVTLKRILPGFLVLISKYGVHGVQVFFILSGFVIAHSLRNNPLTRQSIGNFALRRQIRLDPPYWITIGVALVLHRIELAMPFLVVAPMPRLLDTCLNFFYLQNVTGKEQIVDVAWTLCVEIQFYILFIAVLAGGKLLSRSKTDSQNNKVAVALIFISGCLSLAASHYIAYIAWCAQYWFYFSAGVLCYWSLSGRMPQWIFFSFIALITFNLPIAFLYNTVERSASGPAMIAALVTVIGIYIVGRKEHLTDWWNHSLLQYFGRISYSLYLVHLITVTLVLRAAYKLTGENETMALVWFVIAGLVSIGAAHLLYIAIERPSMRYASKLKRQ